MPQARAYAVSSRRAYVRAATEFFDWLEAKGVTQITAIESVHVATYIEQLSQARSAPTAKLRLAALRHLFDWMVFARIGAAIGMRVEDVYPQNRRLWVRLHEKGGKQHAMPCHHNLKSYLHAYIDGAGLASDPKALLFQTYSRATGRLTGNPLPQANAYAMVQRRARDQDRQPHVSGDGYLKNGGTLERAAQMANHASTRTTQLYDRRAEEVTLDEIERVVI